MSSRWRTLLGVALSAGLLWWTFRGQDPAVIWGNLRDANLWYLLAATVTGTLIFPLRAIRWRVILDPIAPGIPLNDLWRATAIGMAGNNVLPARAGEFARAYVLSKETERVTLLRRVRVARGGPRVRCVRRAAAHARGDDVAGISRICQSAGGT